ncbi:MAG TPA: hypothetical protein DCE14_07585 [Kosmotogaceae bacterium]|nr:MAG: DNA polymerase III gamma/tau subunits-like protein [Thermotogales bacterium 46_20]HAA86189.1 hypothetical protein [Kosmotogaceae bacterium]
MNSELDVFSSKVLSTFLISHPGMAVMLVGASSMYLRDIAHSVIAEDPDWSSRKSTSDLLHIEPDGGNIGIDRIAEARAFFNHRPAYGDRKYLLMTESEQMTAEAANSFLKILEEPPSFGQIIMTCTTADKHLPTIRSRVITFNVSYPVDKLGKIKELYRRRSRHLLAVCSEDYTVLKSLLVNTESVKDLLEYVETMDDMNFDALIERVFNPGFDDEVKDKLIKRKAIVLLLKSISEQNTRLFTILSRLDIRMKKSGQYFDYLREFASVSRSILRDLLVLNTTCEWRELVNTDLLEWLSGRETLDSLEADILWCDKIAGMNRAVLNNRLVLHRVVNSVVKHMEKNRTNRR